MPAQYNFCFLWCNKTFLHDLIDRFDSIKAAGCYYPLVIEDSSANNGNGKIVGTGTLEIEEKFIHSCALVS